MNHLSGGLPLSYLKTSHNIKKHEPEEQYNLLWIINEV